MNAFGKRGGMGGSGRPQFGVAKPMKSSGGAAAAGEPGPGTASGLGESCGAAPGR